MLATLLLASAFLNSPPTVSVGSQRVSLHGSGPPVVFSSGLFGLMPRRLYTKLFRQLEADVTLVVLDTAAPVTLEAVEGIAAALGVEQVGFMSHSSFDGRILESPRVRSAVLCDPVTVPTVGLGLQLGRRAVENGALDTLVVKAEHAYAGTGGTPIPEYLLPDVHGSTEVTFPGVGHADVLDDLWADVAVRSFPFMSGARAPMTPYLDWRFHREDPGRIREVRAEYRARLGAAAVHHFLKHPTKGLLAEDSSARS